jgi:hypothetical protein
LKEKASNSHTSDWLKKAACRGMDTNLFFDYYERSLEVKEYVHKVCNMCKVRKQCYEHAMKENLQGGVFGGVYIPLKRVRRNAH